MICPTGEAKYFYKWGWTANSLICLSGKSVHFSPSLRGAKATKQSMTEATTLDCFAPLAMTVGSPDGAHAQPILRDVK
jgi:hypothetical protein